MPFVFQSDFKKGFVEAIRSGAGSVKLCRSVSKSVSQKGDVALFGALLLHDKLALTLYMTAILVVSVSRVEGGAHSRVRRLSD